MDLKFEELKKWRKVTAIKFTFNPLVVKEVINQKTGLKTKIYTKLKSRSTLKKQRKPGLSKLSDILENQLSFDDETKRYPSQFSSFISKFIPFYKKK